MSERLAPMVTVMVDIPKGSRNKYEYDPASGHIKLDRMLFSAVHYPSDYGFILNTLGKDGDPLDALVLVWEPTFPGCVIDTRPIGVFRMWDEKGQDDKVLCVPLADPMWNHLYKLDDVPPQLLREIEHFFRICKDLEEKKTGVEGWFGLDEALEAVDDAVRRFKQQGTVGKS